MERHCQTCTCHVKATGFWHIIAYITWGILFAIACQAEVYWLTCGHLYCKI